MKQGIAILGIFVADLAFRAGRQPVMGETLMGSGFAMGPGGKGSNQAVAAARAGGRVSFISRLGKDAFGDIAVATWKAEGITPHVALAPCSTAATPIRKSDKFRVPHGPTSPPGGPAPSQWRSCWPPRRRPRGGSHRGR